MEKDKCCLWIALAFSLISSAATAQTIKVPSWSPLMGAKGWPVYYTTTGEIGILDTWGRVREVATKKFKEDELQKIKQYAIKEKSEFINQLLGGVTISDAYDKKEQLINARKSDLQDVANHPDVQKTVNYTSQNQVDIKFNDGSVGRINSGGLQMEGTVIESHAQERAKLIAQANGHKIAGKDNDTYIKALSEYKKDLERKRK